MSWLRCWINNTAATLTAWVRMWMGVRAVNFVLVFLIEMATLTSELPDSAFTLLDSCIMVSKHRFQANYMYMYVVSDKMHDITIEGKKIIYHYLWNFLLYFPTYHFMCTKTSKSIKMEYLHIPVYEIVIFYYLKGCSLQKNQSFKNYCNLDIIF